MPVSTLVQTSTLLQVKKYHKVRQLALLCKPSYTNSQTKSTAAQTVRGLTVFLCVLAPSHRISVCFFPPESLKKSFFFMSF